MRKRRKRAIHQIQGRDVYEEKTGRKSNCFPRVEGCVSGCWFSLFLSSILLLFLLFWVMLRMHVPQLPSTVTKPQTVLHLLFSMYCFFFTPVIDRQDKIWKERRSRRREESNFIPGFTLFFSIFWVLMPKGISFHVFYLHFFYATVSCIPWIFLGLSFLIFRISHSLRSFLCM